MAQQKADLRHYLQLAREALLWKLDGLSEYDLRRPLVPSGTNLLGLVKHVAGVEGAYLGDVFGRRLDFPVSGFEDDAEPNADMWATADESVQQIVGFYRDGLPRASGRLRNYLDHTGSAVLDEPATARALADYLLRAANCGATNAAELHELTGLSIEAISELARPGR